MSLDKDLLVELEQKINKILEYTLDDIEEKLTTCELDIQLIFKEFNDTSENKESEA